MNIVKKIAIAAAFLCAATAANAEGLKIGGKVNYFAVQPTGDGAEDMDMSFLGLGAGVAFEVPLGPVTLNPGVEFYYSKPFNQEYDVGFGKIEASVTELGISVPVVVQYPISDAYAGVGVQLNLPLSSKTKVKTPEMSMMGIVISPETEVEADTEDRSAIDLGIAIVAGYNVSENISVGAKGVIGLSETVKDSKTKYNQYGIGVTYFF